MYYVDLINQMAAFIFLPIEVSLIILLLLIGIYEIYNQSSIKRGLRRLNFFFRNSLKSVISEKYKYLFLKDYP